MSSFWKKVVSSKDPSSTKRLITLIVSGHFVLAAFTILFICGYLVFYLPKGKIDKDILDLLKQILYYDVTIILAGTGAIAIENLGQAWIERAKVAAKSLVDSNTDKEEEKIKDNGTE